MHSVMHRGQPDYATRMTASLTTYAQTVTQAKATPTAFDRSKRRWPFDYGSRSLGDARLPSSETGRLEAPPVFFPSFFSNLCCVVTGVFSPCVREVRHPELTQSVPLFLLMCEY